MRLAVQRLWVGFLAAFAVASSSVQAGEVAAQPLRLPNFRAGETVQFSSKTTVHNASRGGQALDSGTSVSFEVQVLKVTADGAQLRWTLREGTTWGTETPVSVKTWLASFRNVPIEVETDPSGLPLKITNWASIHDRVRLNGSDQEMAGAPSPDIIEAALKQSFLMYGPTSDLVTMAAMQVREATPVGHTDLQSYDLPNVHEARSIDVDGVTPSTCLVEIKRSTIQTVTLDSRPRPPSVLATSAVVSTADGWIVSLHETLSSPNFLKTTEITRAETAPCP